ncbi:MAG: esterase/lipase family protein [Chthoniobacterales bacterium]
MVQRVPLLLLLALSVALTGCGTKYSKASRNNQTAALARTTEQRALAVRQKALRKQPLEQLGRYLDAADEARVKLAKDPRNTLLQSDYSFAVARVIDIMSAQKLAPWDTAVVAPSATGPAWKLRLTPPFPQPQYHPRHFEFTPSDRYDFKGKNAGDRVLKAGLGAPLIVVGKELDYVKIDRFAQAQHVYYGMTSVIQFRGRDAEIVLLDPLDKETVKMDGRTYDLAGDFQGPLALALADLNLEKRELLGLFKPQEFEQSARLARLEPFNPNKIPVIMIHGLGNSPATWAPLVEFLRGDPEIREHYQFWFFSYPSGLPYPLSAAFLRAQLKGIREKYPGLKPPVIIGHSMGGMISRLLVTDAGMKLWNTYFDKSPDQLPLSERTKRILGGSMIFDAVPTIGRVIFVSPSHRGSNRAVDFWGRLGAKIVGNPLTEDQVYKEVSKYARPEARKRGVGRLPNGIDLLNPDNLFIKTVDTLPLKPGVPYHTILGDRGKGGFLDHTQPQLTDGFVPYWSGHLEGARSEKIIPSNHWTHLHPLGMAEIKRILIEHLGN